MSIKSKESENRDEVLSFCLMEGTAIMATYYLMKNRLILRLEDNQSMDAMPQWIKSEQLDPNWACLNQEQANYRVVIFRDEILEFDEYLDRRKKKQGKTEAQDFSFDL